MSVSSNDRLGFLTLLVPWVLANPGASVTEIAEWFDVPAKQVRDSVRTIAVSGVPGETGTYDHLNLFDIDWDGFELRDEVTITHSVGLNRVQRFTTTELAALVAALNYLAAVLPDEQAVRAQQLAARLGGVVAADTEPERDRELLAQLRAAGAEGQAVEFDYVDAAGRPSHRVAQVRSLRLSQGVWYLIGIDAVTLEGTPRSRTFRIDRMSNVRQTSTAELPVAPDDRQPAEVTLEVDGEGASILVAFGIQPSAAAGWPVRCTVSVASVAALVRHVASLAGHARVLGPDAVRDQVHAHAVAALARYDAQNDEDGENA